MATTETTRGIHLPCPRCGVETDIRLHLGEGNLFDCPECAEEFSVEDIQDLITRWTKVLKWVELMPRDE